MIEWVLFIVLMPAQFGETLETKPVGVLKTLEECEENKNIVEQKFSIGAFCLAQIGEEK